MQCMGAIFAAAACGTACGTLCKGLAKAGQHGSDMKVRQTMYLPRYRLGQPLLNVIDLQQCTSMLAWSKGASYSHHAHDPRPGPR